MPSPLKLVYCGTPQFAVPSLARLAGDARFCVELVVTQPDRPKGRGMELAASPVKQRAQELKLDIAQPDQIKQNMEFRARLETLKPDSIVVVGYGRILPAWMLTLPRLGCMNLHASLLPKYRGAAPIQWAVANGETKTGNTTMLINEGLDCGDILLQEETMISPDDTSITVAERLAASGAELLALTLSALDSGGIASRKQDDAQATLAPILKRSDGELDFKRAAQQSVDRMRGFQPWPGLWTHFRGATMKILAAHAVEKTLGLGEIVARGENLIVGCANGTSLAITELQLEGKRRMSASDFIHGHKPKPGERLGA